VLKKLIVLVQLLVARVKCNFKKIVEIIPFAQFLIKKKNIGPQTPIEVKTKSSATTTTLF